MVSFVQLLIAVLTIYLLLSGVARIIRPKSTMTRWFVGPPRYVVVEERPRTRRLAVLMGVIQVVLAIALAVVLLRLLR